MDSACWLGEGVNKITMAEGKANRWELVSMAFAAGAFIITLFRYMDDSDSRAITKEIDKLKLEALREEKKLKLAAQVSETQSPPSTSLPESA